jgi:hypothetical protein
MLLEGGCECGRMRYRLEGPPIFVNCCHCRQCQKIGGSAFALNAMIESARVAFVGGPDDAPVEVDGSARCPACRTLLWALHPEFGGSILFIRVGTLDEGERLPPDAHFFVRSKHPWLALPEGVPSFDTLPGEGDPPLLSPEAAARLEAARR